MDGVKWIKLYTDIFDNNKIVAIEHMPDGDAILVIWLKILALAGKCNNNGMIFLASDIPYTDQLLADKFNKPLQTIQLALNIFVRFHMIDIVNDIICVSNWSEYQNANRLSEIREYNRIAKQKSREKQKLMTGEKESTKEKDIILEKEEDKDIDIDIDIEGVNDMSMTVNDKNQQKKKKTDKKELNAVLDSFSIDGELREAFYEFIDMREKKKRPLTQRALKGVVNKLFNLSEDYNTQIKIIDQALEHSWDTVYELKQGYSLVNHAGPNGVRLSRNEDHSLDGVF